jgi:hypothetical protein
MTRARSSSSVPKTNVRETGYITQDNNVGQETERATSKICGGSDLAIVTLGPPAARLRS